MAATRKVRITRDDNVTQRYHVAIPTSPRPQAGIAPVAFSGKGGKRVPRELVRVRVGATIPGVLYHAHVCEGSVVRKTFRGLTASHTKWRADRWVARHFEGRTPEWAERHTDTNP
jgi:hypothetical protein